MGRQHVRDGLLYCVQSKTGAEVAISIMPPLQAAIDTMPSSNMTFLTTKAGAPFMPEPFGAQFRRWCAEAGLPKNLSIHGLRKAFCRRHAEAGRSTLGIMSLSGHKTLREVERYTKAANRKDMGIKAMLETYREQELAHGKHGLAHGTAKPLRGKA